MTNFFLKNIKSKGAVTLIITIILILLSTLLIFFAANFGMLHQKSDANLYRNDQAFEAAEAGLEFGINYLKDNSTTILAGPVNGFISYSNASITNISLANGSKFTVVYTNPVASDYTLIKITSTGTNSEGSSTRVVSQLVKYGSILLSPPNIPIVSQGDISMSGNASVTNTQNNTTIQSAGDVTLSGSSQTVLNGGTSSTAALEKSDIQENVSSIGNLSQSDFFASYFGSSSSLIKSKMQYVYDNSTSTNYSSVLDGVNGASIWITQTGGTASINGNTTIGTPTNPVLLIVNGGLTMSGNITIYGYVFVFGTNTIDSITGNVNIYGGIASTVNFTLSGNININYDPTTISNLQNLSTMKYYAKVPGTWKDF